MRPAAPLLGLALVLALRAAGSEAPPFSVTVDRTKAAVGDRVVATYSARIPDGARIEIEALVSPAAAGEARPAGGSVLEFEPVPPAHVVKSGAAFEWSGAVAFAPFAPGTIEVPGPRLVYVSPSGERIPVRPPAVTLEVSSRLPQGQKPEELAPKSDRGARIPARSPWFYAAIATAVLAVAALVIWLVRRRRKGLVAPELVVPALPPGAELLSTLERLARDADSLGDDPRDFYSALTHAVKRYLERHTAQPVLEWTTFETLRRLRDLGWEFPREIALSELLGSADHVKFGRGRSTRNEAQQHLARVRQLHQHVEARVTAEAARTAAATAAKPTVPAPPKRGPGR